MEVAENEEDHSQDGRRTEIQERGTVEGKS